MRSTLTAPLAEAAVPVQNIVQGNAPVVPVVPVFATLPSQREALERLVTLNNEGSSLLRHSLVKGRDAMAVFQTALTLAVDLAESCDAAEDTTMTMTDLPVHQEDLATRMEDLCRFAPVPMPASTSSSSDTTNSAVFYFYQQVVYLNPAGVQQLGVATPSNTTRVSIRSLSRLYLVVLLWNASLACYQLGHTCLLQPNTASRSYALKAQTLFRKSLELYAQLTSLTSSPLFANLSEPSVATLTRYLTLAAANNYTLVCLQQGHVEAARPAQHTLCRLLQEHQPTARWPRVWQGVLQEFLLNTTVMTVTAFQRNLSAGAA